MMNGNHSLGKKASPVVNFTYIFLSLAIKYKKQTVSIKNLKNSLYEISAYKIW
jgi:hypothetical protein